jgi:drug/metabolite transporter (DMT)-like permease
LGLLFLGIMCTLISHTLWVRVTTTLSTKTTSVIYYLYVPVSLILSVVVLDERVDTAMIAGAGLIMLANVLGVFHHLQGRGVYA